MKRKLIATLLLCGVLLCGCDSGRSAFEPAQTPAVLTETPLAPTQAGTYYEEVWRGDTRFESLVYEHCDRDYFDNRLAQLRAIARRGGTAEAFDEIDNYLLEELYYVADMGTLASIAYYRNPADPSAAEESRYCEELYYEMNDAYCLAMHELAVSEHADIMAEIYHPDTCAWFREYRTGQEQSALMTRENALVQEYYALLEAGNEAEIARVYVDLVNLRRDMAQRAGYGSFADYAYENYYFKTYTPQETAAFAEHVKSWFVPLYAEFDARVRAETKRLWSDTTLPCDGETVLRAMEKVLPQISPGLSAAFDYMREYGLYDIDYDEAKAEIGFTARLYYWNEPFIFNAPADDFTAYLDMFHEFGHFVNSFYTMGDLLFGMADNDLCELQSQGLEMLMLPHYETVFGPTLAPLAERFTIMNMLDSVITGAMYDEFQQRVFAETELTPARVNEIYAGVCADYGYEADENEWIWVLHNFEHPFYYISYAVSALGALELYADWLENPAAAVDCYMHISAMDTEVWEYTQALEEVGLGDFMSEETSRAAAAAVRSVLAQ